jgi:hypothetical protein
LRTYLVQRPAQDAAGRHINVGNVGIRASQEFQALLDRRLTRPNGGRRKVATVPHRRADRPLRPTLAHLAPW